MINATIRTWRIDAKLKCLWTNLTPLLDPVHRLVGDFRVHHVLPDLVESVQVFILGRLRLIDDVLDVSCLGTEAAR